MADEMEALGKGQSSSPEPKPGVRHIRTALTLKVKSYLSVAWVRTSDYWDDIPGRRACS